MILNDWKNPIWLIGFNWGVPHPKQIVSSSATTKMELAPMIKQSRGCFRTHVHPLQTPKSSCPCYFPMMFKHRLVSIVQKKYVCNWMHNYRTQLWFCCISLMIRITRISVCIWDMMVCDVYRPTPQFSYSLTLFPDSQRFSRLCWRKIALWLSSFSGNRRGKAPSERNHRRLPRCHNELCQYLNNCGVSKYWVEENWLNTWMTFRELAYFILEGFINRTRTLVEPTVEYSWDFMGILSKRDGV